MNSTNATVVVAAWHCSHSFSIYSFLLVCYVRDLMKCTSSFVKRLNHSFISLYTNSVRLFHFSFTASERLLQ